MWRRCWQVLSVSCPQTRSISSCGSDEFIQHLCLVINLRSLQQLTVFSSSRRCWAKLVSPSDLDFLLLRLRDLFFSDKLQGRRVFAVSCLYSHMPYLKIVVMNCRWSFSIFCTYTCFLLVPWLMFIYLNNLMLWITQPKTKVSCFFVFYVL